MFFKCSLKMYIIQSNSSFEIKRWTQQQLEERSSASRVTLFAMVPTVNTSG